MDFILRQMAQFTARMQRDEEEQQKREWADTRRDFSIAQIRRILAQTIWEFRRDRRYLNERMAALANAQLRSEASGARLDESMAALVDAQIRSEDAQARFEEKHARSDEWRAQMEESFARSTERLAYLEVLTARNSEAISKLTDVVGQGRRRSGGEDSA
ncbi:MAG: hypothetical protein ABR603_11040 [Pyrinomonadaceae bacterium]